MRLCEPLGALDIAVGDQDIPDALLAEVPGDELDGLSGPDEQCRPLVEVVEDLLGHADRGEGHGDGVGADIRVGAHLLGDGEGMLE